MIADKIKLFMSNKAIIKNSKIEITAKTHSDIEWIKNNKPDIGLSMCLLTYCNNFVCNNIFTLRISANQMQEVLNAITNYLLKYLPLKFPPHTFIHLIISVIFHLIPPVVLHREGEADSAWVGVWGAWMAGVRGGHQGSARVGGQALRGVVGGA